MGLSCHQNVVKNNSLRTANKSFEDVALLPVVLYGCEIWSHTVREEQIEGTEEKIWT
jgi:hypothetical protein